jgi:phage terminase Nu1 subunit (DNA packaging protein)
MTSSIKFDDLAQTLGTTPKAVGRAVGDGATEQEANAAALKAFMALAATGESGPSISRERVDLIRIQRQLAQVELDRQKGTLVDVEAVAEEVAAVFATVRNLLLGLPAKLAPRVIRCETTEAARDLLLREIQGILRELSAASDDEDEGTDAD